MCDKYDMVEGPNPRPSRGRKKRIPRKRTSLGTLANKIFLETPTRGQHLKFLDLATLTPDPLPHSHEALCVAACCCHEILQSTFCQGHQHLEGRMERAKKETLWSVLSVPSVPSIITSFVLWFYPIISCSLLLVLLWRKGSYPRQDRGSPRFLATENCILAILDLVPMHSDQLQPHLASQRRHHIEPHSRHVMWYLHSIDGILGNVWLENSENSLKLPRTDALPLYIVH